MVAADEDRAARARFAVSSKQSGGIDLEATGGIGRDIPASARCRDRRRGAEQQAANLLRWLRPRFGQQLAEQGA